MSIEDPMSRDELRPRLRWLAEQWRNATPDLRRKIEEAFRNGEAKGKEMLKELDQ